VTVSKGMKMDDRTPCLDEVRCTYNVTRALNFYLPEITALVHLRWSTMIPTMVGTSCTEPGQ